jgi:hypothetical protein
MDCDIKLRQLKEEIRHEMEMRRLQTSHLDAHDASFAQVREIIAGTAEQIKELVGVVNQLAVAQGKTEAKLLSLIESLAREHSNGHTKS